jgi:hypothetical protein
MVFCHDRQTASGTTTPTIMINILIIMHFLFPQARIAQPEAESRKFGR